MSVPKPANFVPASRWTTHRVTQPAAATIGTRDDGTPRVAPGVYLLTRDASPQFAKPITVRVIRERTDRHTYDGWTWIEAYQLDARGDATDRRELFVRPDGMRPVRTPPATPGPARRVAARAAR
ncbi:hypothetical protein SAMN05443287_112148 [Micromonospora phaseoli]|uniref:Uncharacterized protein n=1 Tax=Micromonospora phaseoli TaxID=1144548 RepID=A0A1H7DA95_9ACTN|nr:hypothetical protein [Micromonospora phaseoli]PZV90926.1 hypothetical protein CLV64_112149 [Micromonospora phaseoli]GIJ77403.1 hypothetical protein Xph01_18350 [Micromonospora phaseoli]SEJ98648.1 hypothetical protein SAMN05443287_112148 [Micromonospora phaseoli]